MKRLSRWVAAGLTSSLLLGAGCRQPQESVKKRELCLCADPNNLPFSNERREGFENRLAQMIADEMDAELKYVWWAQRRGFIRNTLRARLCDVIMGVPSNLEMVLPTRPLYRSTYVFVYRADSGLAVRSLDDPVLRKVRIGVQLVGDDYTNTPPAHALSRRGVIHNVVGYRVTEDYSLPNPPARIIDGVVKGDIDVGVVWGPLAGYFAGRSPVPLKVVPVTPQFDSPTLPLVFDVSLGVRREDEGLLRELEAVLEKLRPQVDRLLEEYGVPRVDLDQPEGVPEGVG